MFFPPKFVKKNIQLYTNFYLSPQLKLNKLRSNPIEQVFYEKIDTNFISIYIWLRDT